MINDIYDLDTQKKTRYHSESSNASTSGYSTMSPGPSTVVGVGNISPSSSSLFSMPSSPVTSALQTEFSNLNLPSNSPQQQLQQQYTTLQNVSSHVYAANSNYNNMNYSQTEYPVSSLNSGMQCPPTTSHKTLNLKSEYPARLRLLEQPAEKFRFRYKSEMHGTHGSLNGVNSTRTQKTFPEVQLENYSGYAVIRCSLFQTDVDSPHSHQLVVRKDDMDICDPHDVHIPREKGNVAQFLNMGIIHTAKKFINDELYKKKKNRLTFELGRNELTAREVQELRKETENEAKKMNLNQVRLCFEAFKIEDDRTWTRIAAPIFTHSINNRKSAQTGELRICRLSIATGSVNGEEDLILLVEKVSKKNIKVRFYELNEDEEIVWEDYAKFRESDVHHQYAIVCTTPAYKNKDIDKPVQVFIELVRPSDDERSNSAEFRYKPRDAIVSRKRRRTCSTATNSSGSNSNSMSSFEIPKSVQEQTAMLPPAAMVSIPAQQQQFQQQYHIRNPASISEEFNKEEQLKGLVNDDNMQQYYPDSITDLSLDIIGYLDQDGASSSFDKIMVNQKKLFFSTPIQTNNSYLDRIFKLYDTARKPGQTKNTCEALAKQVASTFLEYSSQNDDSIMHDFVLNNNVKLCIKTCEILKFFDLNDILNTTVNANRESCLHYACLHNKSHFIRPFLLLGCDPNLRNHIGNTALHIAVEEHNKNCIDSFLTCMTLPIRHRINLKLTNDAGLTPLHLAIRSNSLELIEKFLQYDKNAASVCNRNDGNNALHMAVLEQNVPLIKLILDLRIIDLETRNTAGRTVIDLTKTMDPTVRKEILNILLKANPSDGSVPIIKLEDVTSSSSTDEDEDETEEMDKPLELVKVKVETSEVSEENDVDVDTQFHEMLCDEEIFSKLCRSLEVQDRWRKLAYLLNKQHFVCLWSSPEVMLTYIRKNVKSIGYGPFCKALGEIDKDALLIVKNM